MSQTELAPAKGRLAPPFTAMLVGLGIVILAALCRLGGPVGLSALLIFIGLVVAGAGLASGIRRWRDTEESADRDWSMRAKVPCLWFLGTVSCAIASSILAGGWDSMAMFCSVLAVFSGLAAVVAFLPTRWRRLAISLLIVFHFAAIAMGVVVVPPPNGPAPYWPMHLWMRYARPYLQFLNINNGYHFYAPDPGPSTLLWFRVEYADGTSRWVRWPDHDAVLSHIERRRYGSLATTVSQTGPIPEQAMEARLTERRKTMPPENFVPLHGPDARPDQIPLGPVPPATQYREPTLEAKMLIANYARYVARTTRHPLGENSPVKGVKIYRVEYHNPPVQHFQAGRDPYDPTLYMAYYQGEFDADGRIKPSSLKMEFNANGEMISREQDPLLYWLIPIVKVISQEEAAALPPGPDGRPDVNTAQGRIVNYVRIHAGDPTEESIP